MCAAKPVREKNSKETGMDVRLKRTAAWKTFKEEGNNESKQFDPKKAIG